MVRTRTDGRRIQRALTAAGTPPRAGGASPAGRPLPRAGAPGSRDRAGAPEVVGEGRHAAARLTPVVVLVRGVVAVLREREAEEVDRRLEHLLHREHGAYRSPLPHERGLAAE